MSRYRKIQVKTWTDIKFKSLSPIPPCGQGLWLWLLTGPYTQIIPGLFAGGVAGMAESLDWDAKAFQEAFREVFSKGLIKHDGAAKLVFIPKAIKYNMPQSPNVIKSWSTAWEELPECALKNDAWHSFIKAFGFSEAFGKAFAKACPKPSLKAIANQEQEQEQDIYKHNPPLLSPPCIESDATSTKKNKVSKKFTPPTLEEVTDYILTKEYDIDPRLFFNHYEANGWVQGRGKPIKKWKACVQTWIHNDRGNKNGNGTAKPKYKSVTQNAFDQLNEIGTRSIEREATRTLGSGDHKKING